jgi:hypothetical protein
MAWACGIERPVQPSPRAVLVGGRFVGVQPRSSAGLEGVRAAVAGGRSGGRFVGVQPRSSAGLEGVRAAVAGGRSGGPWRAARMPFRRVGVQGEQGRRASVSERCASPVSAGVQY